MADNCISANPLIKTPTYTRQGAADSKRERLTLVPEPITGYELYDSDNDPAGFCIVCPKEAYNLVQNPTFFVDTFGWETFNSTMNRTNAWSFDSGFSVRVSGSGDIVTAERRAYIQTEIFNFNPGDIYVFSGYAWLPQVWDLNDPLSGTISIVDSDGVTEEEVFSGKLENFQQWRRLDVSKAIRTTATNVYVRLNLRSIDQLENQPPHNPTGEFNRADEYIYFDMLQFEKGIEPTTPFHGDTAVCDGFGGGSGGNGLGGGGACAGYTWSGAAHKSASHRDSCVRDGGELVSLSSLGFQMLSHSGHMAPPVRDIAYPFANKPGEHYVKTAIDARVLTFTGAICEGSLKALECDLFGLGTAMFPTGGRCKGNFLLVYKQENCLGGHCSPDTQLALCVTYIGGFESGVRDNLFQQRLTLQFKAHDPVFWFTWPNTQGTALNYTQFSNNSNVVQLEQDGTFNNVPIPPNLDICTAACLGSNGMFVGGDFAFEDADGNCIENIAIIDCNDFCVTGAGAFGPTCVSTVDSAGNVLFGGEAGLGIIYAATGEVGSFPGYPGGEPLSIAAGFWHDVAVGDANGVYIMLNDGTWLTYATDGPVNGLALTSGGILYAVGDFTTIDGVAAERIARLVSGSGDCSDTDNLAWESLGFGVDGPINAIAIDQATGQIYIGGNFTTSTPDSEEVCVLYEDTVYISSGSNQEFRFVDIGGDQYTLELRLTNVITQQIANQCFTTAPADQNIKITGSSSTGTQYSFLFGAHNVVGAPVLGTVGALFTITFTIDVNAAIGSPCSELNTTFTDELLDTTDFIQFVTPLNLPGGVGVDDELSEITVQCIQLETVFTADSTDVNNIAVINGDSIAAMGEGSDDIVNVIAINPNTSEVWVGTESGLKLWIGHWLESPLIIDCAGDNAVLSISYCADNCSMVFVLENSTYSMAPGISEVCYTGSADDYDAQLVIHGPGVVKEISNHKSGNKAHLCLTLVCDEIAVLDMGTGTFSSNQGRNLSSSILPGSRLDLGLLACPTCGDSCTCSTNPVNVLITDTGPTTRATLLSREKHWGIESLCCSCTNSLDGAGVDDDFCCPDIHIDSREPTAEDCDYPTGSLWFNACGPCGNLSILVDNDCEDCDEYAGGFIDGDGAAFVEDTTDEVYCPDETLIDDGCA